MHRHKNSNSNKPRTTSTTPRANGTSFAVNVITDGTIKQAVMGEEKRTQFLGGGLEENENDDPKNEPTPRLSLPTYGACLSLLVFCTTVITQFGISVSILQ